MKTNAVLIDYRDNVVTVTNSIAPGEYIVWAHDGKQHSVKSFGVPAYHKAAIADLEQGENVVKYGAVIAETTIGIKAGQHVHIHNCKDPARESEKENNK